MRKSGEGFIISHGNVRAPGDLNESLFLVTGDVVTGGMIKSAIISDGDIHLTGVWRCLIIARGNVVVDGHSQENTIIAGGNVTLKKPGGTVNPRSDLRDHVQSGVKRPLGYITFFELSTVGVEVKVEGKSLQVTTIADGKPFADAGREDRRHHHRTSTARSPIRPNRCGAASRRPGHRRRDRSARARRQDGDGESGAAGVRRFCSWMIP